MTNPNRPLNRWSVASLVLACTIVAFPIAIPLAILALYQLRGPTPKEEGRILAALALLLSGVFLPGTITLVLMRQPSVLDACLQHRMHARAQLRTVHFLQERFLDKHGHFASSIEELGFVSQYGARPYDYQILSADNVRYRARAEGNHQMTGDVVEMDQTGKSQVTDDLCKRERAQ